MSALDACCVFMKELAFRYKVPAELHLCADGSVRIHISRSAVTAEQEREIINDAEKRGLKQQAVTHWITLSG